MDIPVGKIRGITTRDPKQNPNFFAAMNVIILLIAGTLEVILFRKSPRIVVFIGNLGPYIR